MPPVRHRSESAPDMPAAALVSAALSGRSRRQSRLFQLLSASLDHLSDMVIITEAAPLDEPGPRIVFVNRAMLANSGYAQHEVLGRSPRMFQGPQTQRDALDRVRAALAQGQAVQVELINHKRDGTPYWVDMEIVPVPNELGEISHYLSIQQNITDRVEISAALRDSEERFRSLTELSSDWFWEQDEQLRFVRFDGNLPRNFVHARSLGRHPWEAPALNMTDADWAAHRQLLLSQQPFKDLELLRPLPDGGTAWISVSGEPMFHADGRFRGYRGVGRYITERKATELRLQAANELLRVSVENIRQGLVMVDATGRIHLYNQRFLELLDLPASLLEREPTAQALLRFQIERGDLDDNGQPYQANIDALLQGQPAGADQTYIRRTRQGRVLEIGTRTLEQGGFVRTYTDLTDHLDAQEALRQSEERFRHLTQLSSDWYWEQDAQLRYTRLEGRGIDPVNNEFIGKLRWELDAVNLDAAQWAEHRRQLEAHQEFHRLEVHRILPDGRSFWTSISGTPIFDSQGTFQGYRGVTRNITAAKRAEQETLDRLAFSQRLTRNVPGMVYQMHRLMDGRIVSPFVSDGARELFRCEPDDITQGRINLMSLVAPEDRQAVAASQERSARELKPWVTEYRVRFEDGTQRWHATQARPEKREDGTIVWYGYTGDITERVRVGERLRDANELLEATLASLSQGVVMFDAEARAVFHNRQFLALMDFPESFMATHPTLEQMVDYQYERGDFGAGISREQVAGFGRIEARSQRLISPGQYVRRRADGRVLEIKTRELASGGWVRTYADVSDYFEAQDALQRSEERLHLVLQGSNDGAWDWNLETGEAYFSPRWWDMLGLRPDEKPSQASLWSELTHPLDQLRVSSEIEAALQDGTRSFELEFRMRHADGREITVLDRGFISRDERGRAVRMTGTLTDITARKRLEQRLEESEARMTALFEAIPDRIWLKDLMGRYVLCNPGKAAMYGRTVEDMLDRTEAELMPDTADLYGETDRQALQAEAPVIYEQNVPLYPGGPVGVFEVVKRAVFDHAGGAMGVLGVARDITERKRAEAQIERLAFYDPLTQLCNRRLFQDRLEQAQAASARSGQWAAVCFIDLDNFKDLNDTLGHDTGDHLLQQVGQRLQSVVREQDTVARLGGDEFVVLVEQLGSDADAAALYANQVGQKVLQVLNTPYELSGGLHHNTPSIGVTLFRDHAERTEDILKRADLAMYQSKSAGRNTVRFFDPTMQAIVLARSALERDLRQALVEDQLLLHYQPVVNTAGRVTGYEALLRWQHPVRGMVSPAQFVPVAEQTGLILSIGQWVLRSACDQLARWAGDPAREALTLAVNLSARQLRQNDFVPEVRQTLKDTGARPERLKLELTESLLLHDVEETIHKMQQLADEGIRFALDDFGTGYSSLSYLKRLPLSQLKIDQSFVRDLLTDPNDAAIARTILQLAQSLDLDVVAEGVETEGQRQFLELMGCKAFQGYLFGRPGPLAPDR